MRLPSNPIDNPADWQSIQIGGLVYDYVKVSGFKRDFEWDIKSGKGAKGGTSTFTGVHPSKGVVEFYAWMPEHFDTVGNIVQMMNYDPTKKSTQAITIWHPALVEVGVFEVTCAGIEIWEESSNGLYTRKIDFIEYKPAPKVSAVATPANATDGAASTGDPPGAPGYVEDPAIKEAKKPFDDAAKEMGDLMKDL